MVTGKIDQKERWESMEPRKKVLVTGCFNICHAGHCRLFEFAARYGELVVGINSQDYVQDKYGDAAVPLNDRATCVRSNRHVEQVLVFHENEPSKLIQTVYPDFYIKGPDYRDQPIPELDVCEELGIQVIYHPDRKTTGSTEIVNKNKSILSDDLFPLENIG